MSGIKNLCPEHEVEALIQALEDAEFKEERAHREVEYSEIAKRNAVRELQRFIREHSGTKAAARAEEAL
jgi:hypothetical protein